MPGKFEIKKARNGEFYFYLKAGNGEVILRSENYMTKASVKNGISSVKKNSTDIMRYDRRVNKGGKDCFVLKAANHQVIGKSAAYNSKASMEHGIESVEKNAGAAEVIDLAP